MRLSLIAAAMSLAVAACAAIAPAAAVAETAGVSLDVRVSTAGQYFGTAGLTQASAPLDLASVLRLTPGVTAGKADKAYVAERTLAASATENLDLAGGLTDPVGASLTFAKVKAVVIFADAGNTNNVVVGGAASNGFTGPFADATDKVVIKPGGMAVLTDPGAGWTVTAATGDLLLVANSASGTSVKYRVLIVGVSS